jgi:hypothetical protein
MRLVAKGAIVQDTTNDDNNATSQYPCPIANRFECPYDYGNRQHAIESSYRCEECAESFHSRVELYDPIHQMHGI